MIGLAFHLIGGNNEHHCCLPGNYQLWIQSVWISDANMTHVSDVARDHSVYAPSQ